jgi:hypothetical protein
MSLLGVALDPATVIVAVDPGKVCNRVWVSDGSGLLTDPVSLPVAREGIRRLDRLLAEHAAVDPVTAVEATGSLHRSWVAEMERRRPGSVRLFAPSETKAARMQLGSAQIQDRRSRLRGTPLAGSSSCGGDEHRDVGVLVGVVARAHPVIPVGDLERQPGGQVAAHQQDR